MNQEKMNNIKKMNILYVEDDLEIQKFFGSLLQSLFNTVVIASNGLEGLNIFKDKVNQFDFVISDIEMPEMNGLTMLEEIKKIEPKVPCILTTAHGEFDYFMKANELGVFRYMQKPLDINELLEAVNDFQSGLEVKKIDL
jgi:DNA-binding NtrC family response regulator